MQNRGKVALLISGGRIVTKAYNAPGDDYVPLTSEEIYSLLRKTKEKIYIRSIGAVNLRAIIH